MLRAFLLVLSVITAFPSIVLPQHVHSAVEVIAAEKSENSELIDEFGQLGHCDFTGRIDTFLAELQN